MFQGRSIRKKICGQGQKNVTSRIVPTNIQKFLCIVYGLLKMTTECYALDSEPEPTNGPIKSIFTNKSNYTQCFNIPSGHRFAFKIHQLLPQINLRFTNKFMASIIEEHFHYKDLYADFLNQKIARMEFANTKRIQIYLIKSLKENCGRILTALALTGCCREKNWIQNFDPSPVCDKSQSTSTRQETHNSTRLAQHLTIH